MTEGATTVSPVITRAKFRCSIENARRWAADSPYQREYELTAVYDDGTPEHQRYAKATPIGKMSLTVDNPAVELVPGRLYYIDLIPAD